VPDGKPSIDREFCRELRSLTPVHSLDNRRHENKYRTIEDCESSFQRRETLLTR
jgi:hypothetical protein